MNKEKSKKFIKNHFYLLISLLFIVLITLIAVINSGVSKNVINSESNSLFENNWEYSTDDKNFQEVVLPIDISKDVRNKVILKNRTPLDIIKGATVLIRTSQQTVKVYIDDTIIYDTSSEAANSSYHFVRLPNDCSDEEILIELFSPYKNYEGMLNQICIGSKASNIFHIIKINGFKFLVGAIIFILGIFTTSLFFLSKLKKYSMNLVYLGGFFLFSGFWVLSESKMLQFLFPFPASITALSIFSLTISHFLIGMYLFNQSKGKYTLYLNWILRITGIVSLAVSLSLIFSYKLSLMILPFVVIFVAVFILLMFIISVLQCKENKNFKDARFYGFLSLLISCFIELTLYFFNFTKYNESNFLIFGLFVFCLITLFDSTKSIYKIYQSQVLITTLTKLAYKDSLTDVCNSAAFYEYLEKIKNINDKKISFIIYDVNDLKIVNDTKGHLVGNKLLKNISQILMKSFNYENDIYRIGGDEFVAVIFENEDFNYDEYVKKTTLLFDEMNLNKNEYEISAAIGYATYDSRVDVDLFGTFSRADKQMYLNKNSLKNSKE